MISIIEKEDTNNKVWIINIVLLFTNVFDVVNNVNIVVAVNQRLTNRYEL